MFCDSINSNHRIWRRQPRTVIVLLSLLLINLSMGSLANCADVIIVRPKQWSESLQAWKLYRQKQGHRIWEVDGEADGLRLQQVVHELANKNLVEYIVLAGDVQHEVPTFYHASTALVQYGGPASLASDLDYGDLDSDGRPEVAVGRIPAQSGPQLQAYLDRVMAYELDNDFDTWRRDVHVVAGVGGFGVVADSMIEMTTRKFLSDTVPPWVNLTMTQASLDSNYCPDPINFSQTALQRMNDGGMFWVYIGHGWVDQLDTIRVGPNRYPIFTIDQLPAVRTQHPTIAIFLACYTGAFDAKQDCLAEKLILHQNGPIASIAASRVSGPYGLAILSDGLLRGYYQHKVETLGKLLLDSKKAALDEGLSDVRSDTKSQLGLINSIASAMSPQGYDLKAERQEHVWQVNLIGDPLLRLSHSQALELQATGEQCLAGDTVNLNVLCPNAGELHVELAQRRGVSTEAVRRLKTNWQDESGRQAFDQRYQLANEQILVRTSTASDAGEHQAKLEIPLDLKPGRYLLRAYLVGKESYASGSTEIRVAAQPSP